MKFFLKTALLVLVLSGCVPWTVSTGPFLAPTVAPAFANPPLALTPEIKVVEMATQTPMGSAPSYKLPQGDPTRPAPTAEIPPADPNQPTQTSTPVALPKSLDELGIPSVTYQDKVAGFAFDYPASWLINAPAEDIQATAFLYSVTLRSADVSRGPKQQEGIPPGMAALDITVFNQDQKTLDQAIKERRAQTEQTESGQAVQIVLEEEWTLRDGTQAHRFLYNLGKEGPGDSGPDRMSSELVTVIHGRMILVVGMGDQSLFNVIAASLRELK